MLTYYITDRTQFTGDETARRRRLLDKIADAARSEVDYVQLREKDLSSYESEKLALEVVTLLAGSKTRLLINSRTDVAISAAAAGVHLRSEDVSPVDVRSVWAGKPVIAVSCHTVAEVARAAASGADFAVFGPVFGKKNTATAGLDLLGKACRQQIPVLALGGVTPDNARSCIDAGASGIAAIRLFQDNDISEVMRHLNAN